MNANDDDAFDAMFRTTMAARPEPPDATNLAARAIAMARAARRASPTRATPVARWLPTLVATIAIACVLAVGYAKLAAHFVADATITTTTSDASDLAPTLAVGGVGLLVALVVLVLRNTLSRDDDALLLD